MLDLHPQIILHSHYQWSSDLLSVSVWPGRCRYELRFHLNRSFAWSRPCYLRWIQRPILDFWINRWYRGRAFLTVPLLQFCEKFQPKPRKSLSRCALPNLWSNLLPWRLRQSGARFAGLFQLMTAFRCKFVSSIQSSSGCWRPPRWQLTPSLFAVWIFLLRGNQAMDSNLHHFRYRFWQKSQ